MEGKKPMMDMSNLHDSLDVKLMERGNPSGRTDLFLCLR
jgi:hypothetical protein